MVDGIFDQRLHHSMHSYRRFPRQGLIYPLGGTVFINQQILGTGNRLQCYTWHIPIWTALFVFV